MSWSFNMGKIRKCEKVREEEGKNWYLEVKIGNIKYQNLYFEGVDLRIEMKDLNWVFVSS
jgi:hypothetical protein